MARTRRSERGPRRSGPGMVARMRAYFRQHGHHSLGALGRLARQPVASLLTVAVIGIALALPAGLNVLVANARVLSAGWESAVDFSVYLQHGLELERAEALAAQTRARSGIAAVEIISAEAALAEFREHSGFTAALESLGENPLPHTLVVRPAPTLDAGAVAALAAELEALEEVELVQLDTAWVERFLGIIDIARRATEVTLLLLGLAVIIIVGNTIRLDIQNRRSEIEVMKLIGGSDGFIRRPFLYGGLWYGITGGLLAVILTGAALLALAAPVGRLAGLYGSEFSLVGPGMAGFAALLGAGTLLGWLGAWVATARHLREIEPT